MSYHVRESKRRIRKKPIVQDVERQDQEEQDDFEILEDEKVPKNFSADLKEWLETNGFEDEEKKCTLYKYDNNRSGERRQFTHEWYDEIPSLHEIGLLCGSGRYILFVAISKENDEGKRVTFTRTYKFRINEVYDKLKRDKEEKVNNPSPSHNGFELNVALDFLGKIVGLMAPLMKQSDNQIVQSVQTAKLVNDIIKESAISNMEMTKRLIDGRMNEIENEPEETEEIEERKGLIETILPLIDKYLPMLLKSDKPSESVSMIKNLPQFQEIMQDAQAVKEVLSYIKNKFGAKEAGQVSKMLGVKVK